MEGQIGASQAPHKKGRRVMERRAYDVIVIGAGTTGENVADRVVQGGLRAVIVESELVGGECSYWACMPSKALLRPLGALAAARRVAGSREACVGKLDAAAILARRDSFASHWKDSGQVKWLRNANIELVRGHGRLSGERQVTVVSKDGAMLELSAQHAVAICTGSRASIPDIPGLRGARPWTSREGVSAKNAPRRLAILGGGPVACEMATPWAQLGSSEVTIIQRASRLLPNFEAFVGEAVAKSFAKRGVKILTETSTQRVERRPDNTIRLTFDSGASLEADEVLVATGRAPNTDDIGLEVLGLKPGSWLNVDNTMRVEGVTSGFLYAAGDVNHRNLLTHMGKYQARACGDAIASRALGKLDESEPPPWSRFAATADDNAVPQVIFTDPEIAFVGLTEECAKSRGVKVRVVDYEIGRVAGAILHADDYEGRARMIVDLECNVIVGMTLVGPGVGELIHAATIAVVGAVPIDRLWHAVPAYPTISEIWLRLLETLGR